MNCAGTNLIQSLVGTVTCFVNRLSGAVSVNSLRID